MTAVRAKTVKFEAVGLDRKAVTGSDLFLKPLNVAVFKLHNLSAVGANEMVVVPFVGDVVVLGLGAEVPGLGQASFAKEVERPVNGCQAQMRVFSRQLMVHRFRRDVLLLEKGVQDQLTLASELQLMLPEVLFQHLHLFRMFRHCG